MKKTTKTAVEEQLYNYSEYLRITTDDSVGLIHRAQVSGNVTAILIALIDTDTETQEIIESHYFHGTNNKSLEHIGIDLCLSLATVYRKLDTFIESLAPKLAILEP